MRVGIIQSSYIPWRGYFDFIASVDLFVLYDDILHAQGRSWRNRNQVKTRQGPRWLTVPLVHGEVQRNIDQMEMAMPAKPWRESHRGILKDALGPSPWFADALAIWEEGVATTNPLLSEMNECLLKGVCRYLEIGTPIVRASEFAVQGGKTDRLLALLEQVGASSYLSGPSADAYLDKGAFRKRGIRLEYKSYDYLPYPQLWDGFSGAVTILDMIANCGPEAKAHIRSRTPDVVVA